MEQKTNAFLENEKTGALMRKYAVSCVISLLVAALYNIVDHPARRWSSTLISLLREIVFGVGSPFCFRFFRLDGLLYSFPSPTR
ncbi:MAG: hypothetical protein ACLUI3_16395 [Christensenellales bacterium]